MGRWYQALELVPLLTRKRPFSADPALCCSETQRMLLSSCPLRCRSSDRTLVPLSSSSSTPARVHPATTSSKPARAAKVRRCGEAQHQLMAKAGSLEAL